MGDNTSLPVVTVERILPTRIWIESDIFGSRHVMLQHEGTEPFCYASFFYDYLYTSNSGTWEAAHTLAIKLGGIEPIECRNRPPAKTGWLAPALAQDDCRGLFRWLASRLGSRRLVRENAERIRRGG